MKLNRPLKKSESIAEEVFFFVWALVVFYSELSSSTAKISQQLPTSSF